jgi:glycosyltransferase involved in cell wall biosynthesis
MSGQAPLRVLFVGAWYPTAEKPYLGAFILEHARAVSQYCDVDFLHTTIEKTWTNPGKSVATETISDNLTVHLLTTRMIRSKGTRFEAPLLKHYRQFVEAAQKTNGQYDVIHVNVRNDITKQFITIAEEFDLPIIYTEHWSFYHRGFTALPASEREEVAREVSLWMNHPKVKRILPVSTELAGHFQRKFNAPNARISKVPNVANEVFKFATKRGDESVFKIAMVAGWTEPKNPMLFLKAVAKLSAELQSKIEVDWIGNGPLLDECKAFVEEQLHMPTFHFYGFQSKPFIAEKLQAANLFVHPSDAENLPTVIIESLCCGTPVLSHAVNGIPELVDDSNGILCPPKDVDAFAAELTKIMQVTQQFDCEQIARDAASKFSHEAIGKLIFDQYLQAIDS